jgi:hypothetical protein
MPDLIPAEDGIFDRHPVSKYFKKALDSPSTIEYYRLIMQINSKKKIVYKA